MELKDYIDPIKLFNQWFDEAKKRNKRSKCHATGNGFKKRNAFGKDGAFKGNNRW